MTLREIMKQYFPGEQIDFLPDTIERLERDILAWHEAELEALRQGGAGGDCSALA